MYTGRNIHILKDTEMTDREIQRQNSQMQRKDKETETNQRYREETKIDTHRYERWNPERERERAAQDR